VIAGYNYAQGNTSNPTQSSSAPADTELGKTFPSSKYHAQVVLFFYPSRLMFQLDCQITTIF
jgi:hypothetical protein